MESQSKDTIAFSGPGDQSVEAYKAWIMGIAERLTTPKNKIEFTEAEWRLYWRTYWKEKFQGR